MASALHFRFSSHEAAPRLPGSEGEAKGRLHLFKYTGTADQHRYAVAAEKVTFLFSLFCCFLQNWYIIHEQQEGGHTVQYRISKASLKKRLNISDEKVDSLADAAKFKKFIKKRKAKIKDWVKPTVSPFAQNFVAELVKNKVPNNFGFKLLFAKSSEYLTLKHEDKLSNTVIGYQDIDTVPEFPKESWCALTLNNKRFKAIEKGKVLLPSEVTQMFDPGNMKKGDFEELLTKSTEAQIWILKGKKAERIDYHTGNPLPIFNQAFGVGNTTAGIMTFNMRGEGVSHSSSNSSKEELLKERPDWVPQDEFNDWLQKSPCP